jgi:transcriptional regulator with XRE-family HTH domain
MIDIEEELAGGIAERVRLERTIKGWSLADLSARAGVSKAMLSAIERGEASPTAALLVRIAAAFGLTLSALIARAELRGGRLLRHDDQPSWTDPETGYLRHHLSPASDMPLELIRVELPAGASVRLPAAAYAFIRQQIWLIEGRLDFSEGDVVHAMDAGDCLSLGPPTNCTFHAPGPGAAVYLVALVKT